MKFRRIYFVTEQLGADGTSKVGGVYTSIHDLITRGVQWMEGIDKRQGFRLSLIQLDSDKPPLGTWNSPSFSGIEADLQEFVRSEELNAQEVEGLASELRSFYR